MSDRPSESSHTDFGRTTSRRLHVRLRGRVQGVGFRHFARETARRLGVGGFVRNEPDGTVTVVAEGPEDTLSELLEALRAGPPSAGVHDVETEWSKSAGEFDDFGVRF